MMKTTKRSFAAILCFIALLLCWEETRTQTPGLSGGSVVIKRLSIDDGLSSRFVTCIAQDSRGFIWIGTDNAVNRYDGEKFISIFRGEDSTHISGEGVTSLCGDKEGVVWIGTEHGLDRFDPTTESFKWYFHIPRDVASLSADTVNSLFIDKEGTLWVGTGRGLNRYNRKQDNWTRYYPSAGNNSRPGENDVTSLLEDGQGTLWVATGGFGEISGGGLFRLDRNTGRFTTMGPRRGIYCMFEDRSGELWVGVEGPGLCTVDRSTGRFVPIALPPRDPGSPHVKWIKGICEDISGNLWLATRGWTLLRYIKRTKTFVRYSFDPKNSESISSSSLTAVFKDKDGLLWIGNERAGVNTVSIKPFLHLHTLGDSLHLSQRQDVLFQDRDGFLWGCSSGNGVWRFNPATGKSISVMPSGLVRGITQDDEGIVWLENYFSLERYNPTTGVLKNVWNVPTVRGVRDRLGVGAILVDKEKHLWLGGNSSLFRVSRDMKRYTVFVHDPQNSRSITAGKIASIVEDRSGKVWVSTATGVNRFDEETESFRRYLHDENDSLSLSGNDWPNMCVTRNGTMWIATSKGFNRFDEENSTFARFIPAGREIPNWLSCSIQEDERGRLWGVLTYNRIMSFNPSDATYAFYDRSDGIEDVDIIEWSHTRLKSGEILFGTMGGIIAFHPDSVTVASSIPPLVITGIKTMNHEVRLGISPELLQMIAFSHEENVFSISYAALSYDMPEYNQYAYKLDGFDKEWVYSGNRREAMYTNLNPGTYTFRVKGTNHDRAWNEAGTSLIVVIEPAYWQTWWFRSLSVLIVLGLIGSMYRREVRRLTRDKLLQQEFSQKQIESQEAERKHLASELHDGLGQDLLIVNNELQQFLDDGDRSRDDLRRVAALMQESIEGVREISSDLHPHHIERLGFCSAVEAMVEKLSHSSVIVIQCTCDQIDAMLLKGSEIHLYRIIQESLTNIVRHSCATSARVEIRKKSGSVEVTIEDNGRGFDVAEFTTVASAHRGPTEIARGFGIASMLERARIIGGKLSLESAPQQGTTVHLTLTIPESS